VCTGHIGTLTAKEANSASHSQICGLEVHGQHREQQQHRAGQGVEEELERRIDPPRPAPDADDQEHRDQHRLVEHVEQYEIERAEHADHQRLEHQEGNHVLLDPGLDRAPATDHAERREQRREQDEQNRDAVDPHVVGDVETGQPVGLLDELELGRAAVEVEPQEQRQQEGDQRGPERHVARRRRGLLRCAAAERQDDARAEQRQKGHHREDWKIAHGRARLQMAHDVPGDQAGDPDQHGEGVVVEVAGLQAAGPARQV
jgi:hypothetical protein